MMRPSPPDRFSIYWTVLDPVEGAEMKKTRPCVVVSPEEMNQNLETVIVVPMTLSIRNWPSRLSVRLGKQRASIACDQMRSVSRERLGKRIGALPPRDQRQLLGILQQMFTL